MLIVTVELFTPKRVLLHLQIVKVCTSRERESASTGHAGECVWSSSLVGFWLACHRKMVIPVCCFTNTCQGAVLLTVLWQVYRKTRKEIHQDYPLCYIELISLGCIPEAGRFAIV